MPKKKGNLSPEERLIKAVIPKEEEPYKLPDNWVWTVMNNLVDVRDGTHDSPNFYSEGYPLITSKNLKDNKINFEDVKFISKEDMEKINQRSRVEKGDILYAMIGTIGNPVYCKVDSLGKFAVKNVAIFKSFNKKISKFLKYYLESENYKKLIENKVKGTTQKFVPLNVLRNIYFPLSPLEEQKRIVEKLDSLFEKTGKIKEIIEEVKEKTSLRREAVLSKAFTGELTEKWRTENKTENAKELLLKINEEKLKNNPKAKIKDISEMLVNEDEVPYKIPENWVWIRLGDITTVLSGGTPSTSKEEYYKDGNISWITPKDLSNYKEKYIYKGARNITEEGLRKSSAVLLPKDSVLMSSRAPIGYVVICKKEVSTNQGFKNFAPSISYIPEYLYHYLKKSKNYLESIATGTTFKELSGEKAKKIIFPLPPLEEQKEIVKILDKIFEDENKISELISLEEKVEILEKTILDKAFRGELGTGDTSDEPAIELLKRALENK